jgi:hypothetical protein
MPKNSKPKENVKMPEKATKRSVRKDATTLRNSMRDDKVTGDTFPEVPEEDDAPFNPNF